MHKECLRFENMFVVVVGIKNIKWLSILVCDLIYASRMNINLLKGYLHVWFLANCSEHDALMCSALWNSYYKNVMLNTKEKERDD